MIQLLIRLVCAYLYSALYKIRDYHQNAIVTVVIPVYNEYEDLLHDSIVSVLMSSHKNIEVIVVDDGSTHPVHLSPDIADKVKLIRLSHNQGKMRAQAEGIYQSSSESQFVLTVDSDTTIGIYAIERMLSQFDSETGAVCGEVQISNVLGLNRVIQFLYWNAFNIWRAGSSVFGQVMVCSGAISMYRKSPLLSCSHPEHDYPGGILQEYLDRNIEVGNDRFMTFLFLKHGWKTRYAGNAVALTDAPFQIAKFVKQQVRWNKSFWRGLFYSWPVYGFKNWYFTLDMFLKAISRITTMLLFVWTIVLMFRGSWETVGWILFIALIYGVMHSAAGLIVTRRLSFLLFSIWAILSIFLVAPVNIWSILTVWKDKWGTR